MKNNRQSYIAAHPHALYSLELSDKRLIVYICRIVDRYYQAIWLYFKIALFATSVESNAKKKKKKKEINKTPLLHLNYHKDNVTKPLLQNH